MPQFKPVSPPKNSRRLTRSKSRVQRTRWLKTLHARACNLLNASLYVNYMKNLQMKTARIGLRALLLAFAWFIANTAGRAADAQTNEMDRLTSMSIDDLLNQDVTSVSKKSEKLSKSPAAISVLTQDDIRRSGATSIPEALRLVPGLDVAQVDSQQWAVSARGFNDVFANKLLVLQDGRSLYTPLFSGVFWDVQNPLLEDIDRIEVIRGPGASLWGANAVNGVISIITKSAAETQGFLATASGGNYEQDSAALRYGGQLAEDVYYRVDGQYFDRGSMFAVNGGNAHDAWRLGQGGFRIDWDTRKKGGDLVTLQGDVYGGRMEEIYGAFSFAPLAVLPTVDTERVGGGNILGRWSHSFADANDLTLQTYYDRSDRRTTIFNEDLDTFDIDLQHHFTLGGEHRNDFVWGLGYRLSLDKIGNTPTVSFNPDDPSTKLFNVFAQDEMTLVPDRLQLTVGARLEHNNYTGFEFQPDGRLLWTPAEHHTVWAAVSRAVRTPSEADEFLQLNQLVAPGTLGPGTPALPVTLYGNQNIRSEELLAYQLGYRVEPCKQLSFDVTAFYNFYDHLQSDALGPSPTQPPVTPSPPFIPFHLDSQLHGETYGFELSPTWEVVKGWRLQPTYSLLKMHLEGPDPIMLNTDVGQSPQQQASLRSSMDLPRNVSFDWTVRYVDRLPALGISSYVALDVRLGWRPIKNLELAIVGQNLGSAHHAEFAPTFIGTQRTEIRPGGYAKVTWHF
ncbi:MAG: ligand-gated TonB-dependent outer rane channel [Pedosphaera sp.]|nr:ligand-gated TonB-dependent outer rane channel [Pedosphaera sp.]